LIADAVKDAEMRATLVLDTLGYKIIGIKNVYINSA